MPKNKYLDKALKEIEEKTRMMRALWKLKELDRLKPYKKKPRNKSNLAKD